jgi:hypothetical protein
MYAFDLVPQLQSDVELANWFTSTSPLVPFTSKLIMERVSKDKRYKLIDRRFLLEARDGKVEDERSICSANELAEILDLIFNVSPPYGQKIKAVEKTVSCPFRHSLARWRWLRFFGAINRESAGVEDEWMGRASWPSSRGWWTRSCWRGTNIWPPKIAS